MCRALATKDNQNSGCVRDFGPKSHNGTVAITHKHIFLILTLQNMLLMFPSFFSLVQPASQSPLLPLLRFCDAKTSPHCSQIFFFWNYYILKTWAHDLITPLTQCDIQWMCKIVVMVWHICVFLLLFSNARMRLYGHYLNVFEIHYKSFHTGITCMQFIFQL